jgi:E1A/CREB-binding protein
MLGPQPGSGIASMQNLQSNNPMPMPIKSDLFSSEDVAKIQDNNIMGQQANFGSGIDKSEENKQLMNGSLDNTSGKAFGNLARSEEHRKQVLKQQQQRLLLLRHASKCPHDNCLVTQHCANMKLLWKHIMSCKEHECKVPHCVSSRYVLSHYSKCKEPNCPVCGPVREAIRRNHEKTQSILNLSKLPPLSLKAEGENTGEPKAKKAKSEAAIAKAAAAKAVKAAAKAKSEEGVDKGEAKLDESGKVKKRINKKQKAEGDAEGTGVIQPASKTGPKPKDKKILQQGIIDSSQVPRPAPPPQVITKATALDPVSCAVYGFSNLQIESHIKNIHEGMRMTSSEIRNLCMPIVDGLLKHPSGYIFAYPVDPVALGILDYFEIVKMPMDLGTIKKRLEQSQYRDPHHVAGDVQLVFDNAILYNPKENDYHKVAQQLKKSADNQFKQAIALHEKKIEEMRKHPDACNLCGESNVKFEPPVYYCQGKCGGQRIRRNAYYYSTTNNLNHWCSPCFSDMKENVPIVLPDMTIYKADLLASKKKHQEESEESWVECNICKRWVHQICGLFNSRRNISEEVIFVCPLCLLEKRKKNNWTGGRVSPFNMSAIHVEKNGR